MCKPLRSQVLPKPEEASELSAQKQTEHEEGPHQGGPGHPSGTHGGSHSLTDSKYDAIAKWVRPQCIETEVGRAVIFRHTETSRRPPTPSAEGFLLAGLRYISQVKGSFNVCVANLLSKITDASQARILTFDQASCMSLRALVCGSLC